MPRRPSCSCLPSYKTGTEQTPVFWRAFHRLSANLTEAFPDQSEIQSYRNFFPLLRQKPIFFRDFAA